MKPNAVVLMTHGITLKIQEFKTEKGNFSLFFKLFNDEIYCVKYLNGKLVEVMNFSKMAKKCGDF